MNEPPRNKRRSPEAGPVGSVTEPIGDRHTSPGTTPTRYRACQKDPTDSASSDPRDVYGTCYEKDDGRNCSYRCSRDSKRRSVGHHCCLRTTRNRQALSHCRVAFVGMSAWRIATAPSNSLWSRWSIAQQAVHRRVSIPPMSLHCLHEIRRADFPEAGCNIHGADLRSKSNVCDPDLTVSVSVELLL